MTHTDPFRGQGVWWNVMNCDDWENLSDILQCSEKLYLFTTIITCDDIIYTQIILNNFLVFRNFVWVGEYTVADKYNRKRVCQKKLEVIYVRPLTWLGLLGGGLKNKFKYLK